MPINEFYPQGNSTRGGSSLYTASSSKLYSGSGNHSSENGTINPNLKPKSEMFMLKPEAMIEEMLNDDSPDINRESMISKNFPNVQAGFTVQKNDVFKK
jgi:hypothetical protein